MGRIALGIEYDGAAVYGWQRQREVPSVQEHLERALSTVADTTSVWTRGAREAVGHMYMLLCDVA